MQSQDEALSILDATIASCGGDEADAILIAADGNISRFASSSLHQNMSERSRSLTIRVVAGGRIGIASTTSLDIDEIRRTAAIALSAAERSEPVPKFKGLSDSNEDVLPLETWDEATATIAPREKAEALKRMFDAGAAKKVEFAGSYSTTSGSVAVGNSHGIRRWSPITHADGIVIALSPSDSGFATRASRRAHDVDIVALGDEATEKATLVAGRKAPFDAASIDVILEPAALAEVFEWMNGITFCGNAYEDGSSFFVGQRGTRLVHPSVTLADDATDPDFLPFPFDLEGLAKRRVPLIEEGTIAGPLLDKIMADRLGMQPTGSSSGPESDDHGSALHLVMAGGSSTREELIGTTERGIWVTRFNYVNGLLDPKIALMTGMTRDGTFLIENGRVTKRLPNLRWTQSMLEALSHVDGITAERRVIGAWWNLLGGMLLPTVRIRNWKFKSI
ncbi:MAG: TldD/PmbA family protein [Thermoanaerobaculia bacterium]